MGRLWKSMAVWAGGLILAGCPGTDSAPVLFVLSDYSDSIARVVSFRDPARADGDVRADTRIEGDATEIGIWAGPMLMDSLGALYILVDTSVVVFEHATEADGNRRPDRVAELDGLGQIVGGMALGPTEEWLLAIDSEDDHRFKTYADPTTRAFDGRIPLGSAGAAREEIGIAAGAQYAGGRLYVKDRSDGEIYVYGPGGMITIRLGPAERIGSFFVDQDDTLYASNTTRDIAIYRHASTLEGDVDPDGVLTIPQAQTLGGLIVGSDGTGYITDPDRNAIYIYHDIAEQDGEVDPDGTIQGPHTGLSGPGELALHETQE